MSLFASHDSFKNFITVFTGKLTFVWMLVVFRWFLLEALLAFNHTKAVICTIIPTSWLSSSEMLSNLSKSHSKQLAQN